MQEVEIEELCELGVPVIDDVGSGVLADDLELLREEPAVRRSVRGGRGARVLLGRQAAGRAAGGADGRARGRGRRVPRAHPLARALRIDKLGLAALEATLRLYRDPERARREIPVLAMLTADEATLRARAERARRGGRRAAEVVAATAQRRRRRAAAARAARARCRGRAAG